MKKILKHLKKNWIRHGIETLVVVVGILVAFTLNNLNEKRVEKIEEQSILKQLKAEFESNLEQLDSKIETKSDIIESAMRLIQYVDQPNDRNKDSIDYHIGRTMRYSTFDPITNDLAISGKSRLIRNERLKQYLSHWTSNIKDVQEDDIGWKDYRNNYYVPYLVKHYQLRTIRNKYDINELGQDTIDKEATTQSLDIGNTKFIEDFNNLLDLPDYEDHLVSAYTFNRFAKVQSLILRKKIIEIISILENEIDP